MGVNSFFDGTFEITTNILKSGCAVACKICPQKKLIEEYRPESNVIYLSFDDFVTMLGKIPKTYRIDFSGYAEPFLNKRCMDMIEYASSQGYSVCCYTTLVGVTHDDVERLSKIPFDVSKSCPLHIHLPDKNETMPIKITDKYKGVLGDLMDRNLPFVSYMTMDDSGLVHDELSDFFGKLGKFSAISRGSNLDNVSKVKRLSGKIQCKPMPKLNHNVVLPNGDVQLCCMDYGLDHTLGNILNQSHESLFESEEFLNVVKNMNDDNHEDYLLCRNCEMAIQR